MTESSKGVHRIFVTRDGEKAPLERGPKRTMGAPARGGVWFGNRRDPERVVICEGIEDALAAVTVLGGDALERMAFVAAVSAGRLDAVELPKSARELVLLQDRDRAGEDAWARLRARWEGSGIALKRIVTRHGKDPNDELLAAGPDALRETLAPLLGGAAPEAGERKPAAPDAGERPRADDGAAARFERLVGDMRALRDRTPAGRHPVHAPGAREIAARIATR